MKWIFYAYRLDHFCEQNIISDYSSKLDNIASK